MLTAGLSRCGKIYGRHSKSLDVEQKCCGVCRGLLTFLGRFNKDGTPAKVCSVLLAARFIDLWVEGLFKRQETARNLAADICQGRWQMLRRLCQKLMLMLLTLLSHGAGYL